jgi:sugar phosphate isomerase/epimerase
MRYVYFSKTLQSLDLAGIISFVRETGLDGVDLAVRPGYAVHPDNALAELPKAAKAFSSEGLSIGLVSAPVDMNDPESRTAQSLFEACERAGVVALKIGYFLYNQRFEATLSEARRRLQGFAKLAAKTGVRACYHTHSGNFLGANGAGLRLLLQDSDPHHIGAFPDTGHLAVGGGPIRLELDMVRSWLSLVAIKDMAWEKRGGNWQSRVVPARDGIVRWDEVAKGLKEYRFQGTISLHGEYEAENLPRRKDLAKRELAFLKQLLA